MQTLTALDGLGDHAVQFYEDPEYMCEVIAAFFAAGLATGNPAVAMATPDRLAGLHKGLVARGVDIELACATGQLALIDASDAIESMIATGRPDVGQIDAMVVAMADRLLDDNTGQRVFAYGELAEQLCRRGHTSAAIELEAMWHAHPRRDSFRLLCSHSLDSFAAADQGHFLDLCRNHDSVIPTERYTLESDAARLRRVSALEQSEKALEVEVRRRRTAEAQLAEALLERDELIERERAAREDADAADRAKRDFLAVMNHELRTPLNAIAGYTELLEVGVAGPIREEQREMLVRIQRSQKHLLAMIDEVLTFTYCNRMFSVVAEAVDMAEVLGAAATGVRPQMTAGGLTFECAECDESIIARGDPGRIREIITNLLSNARKYTSAGGTVRITCDRDAARIYVHVRDTGIGIAPHHLESIFEPFFQVDKRLTRVDHGLGLGLAIARRFATAMGGELRVSSRKGEGSIFTLVLPRADADADPDAACAIAQATAATS